MRQNGSVVILVSVEAQMHGVRYSMEQHTRGVSPDAATRSEVPLRAWPPSSCWHRVQAIRQSFKQRRRTRACTRTQCTCAHAHAHAPEAEAHGVVDLGLKPERGVVELQLLQRLAHVLVVVGVGREEAAVHHRLHSLVAACMHAWGAAVAHVRGAAVTHMRGAAVTHVWGAAVAHVWAWGTHAGRVDR